MKITLEPSRLPELEVILRGDITCGEAVSLLQYLRGRNSSKLLLYKEEEQFIVDAEEIVFFEVCGGRVNACTCQETYEAKLKLYEVKELLAAHPFVQINKGTVVNINFVRSIQAEFSGNYRLKLKGRKEVLTVSRSYFKAFKERI